MCPVPAMLPWVSVVHCLVGHRLEGLGELGGRVVLYRQQALDQVIVQFNLGNLKKRRGLLIFEHFSYICKLIQIFQNGQSP